MPLTVGILVSQNFVLKTWVLFLFLFFQCTELECSLLLFSSMLTAVPPYLKLYFRVPLTCSVLYLLLTVDPLQFHTQNLLKEVAQLPILSCTCPVQGNDIEVSTMSVLTDCVVPKVFWETQHPCLQLRGGKMQKHLETQVILELEGSLGTFS